MFWLLWTGDLHSAVLDDEDMTIELLPTMKLFGFMKAGCKLENARFNGVAFEITKKYVPKPCKNIHLGAGSYISIEGKPNFCRLKIKENGFGWDISIDRGGIEINGEAISMRPAVLEYAGLYLETGQIMFKVSNSSPYFIKKGNLTSDDRYLGQHGRKLTVNKRAK